MKPTTATGPGFNKFRNVKPKAVQLPQGELVTMELLRDDNPLPLVIRPAIEDVDLAEWAGSHRDLLEEKLHHHGAILFRGFKVPTAEAFEKVASSVTPDLVDDNGELPRTNISGKIHAVSYAPPEEAILWHNENSFCPGWPMKLWFYCHLPPKAGGETPMVDNRKLVQRLDPEVRRAFEEKKIMYLRNFGRGLDFDWPVSFQTTSREVVEERCKEGGIDFEWKADGGLRTRSVRPAILNHPKTGERVFFCQPALWHMACTNAKDRAAARAFFRDEDLTRHCYFGDGSPIPDDVIHHIMDLYRELEVAETWQQGNIVLIDNMLTAHARNPFVPPREIFASVAEVITEDELPQA